MKMNLPNKLTMFRIILIPFFLICLYMENPTARIAALVLFCIASLTDCLDGYIARKYNLVTNFGKFLDPLADKLLICSILIEMVGLRWVPAWVVIIIIIRELAVTGLRAIAADKGIVMAADRFGKSKTVMQIIALVPLIVHYPFFGIPLGLLGAILLYVALILTIFSGVNYFILFYRDWRLSLSANPS